MAASDRYAHFKRYTALLAGHEKLRARTNIESLFSYIIGEPDSSYRMQAIDTCIDFIRTIAAPGILAQARNTLNVIAMTDPAEGVVAKAHEYLDVLDSPVRKPCGLGHAVLEGNNLG